MLNAIQLLIGTGTFQGAFVFHSLSFDTGWSWPDFLLSLSGPGSGKSRDSWLGQAFSESYGIKMGPSRAEAPNLAGEISNDTGESNWVTSKNYTLDYRFQFLDTYPEELKADSQTVGLSVLSTMHNSQKWGQSHQQVEGKYNVMRTSHGILCGLLEAESDTCHITDPPWKH